MAAAVVAAAAAAAAPAEGKGFLPAPSSLILVPPSVVADDGVSGAGELVSGIGGSEEFVAIGVAEEGVGVPREEDEPPGILRVILFFGG